MKKVSLLDCTLRDGAYIVDGAFGKNAIRGIIHKLQEAKVDIIECGWLKDYEHISGTTYFHTSKDLIPYLENKAEGISYVAMMDWDRYDLKNLPICDGRGIDAIRIVFPRDKYEEALELSKAVKEKGYRVFFQAANTLGYRDRDLIDMLHAVNKAEPEVLSIVDTFGAMYEEDLTRIISIIDHNLDKTIKIGWHSHNNLQQSFALSIAFLKWFRGSERQIVVDASLFGMGRGAGNAPTELVASYLNKFYNTDYDMDVIMDAIDLYMTHFIRNFEWGYSIPYFLSGTYCAHVNNIAYLKKSHRTSNADIKGILESMPPEKRLGYDYDLLERKYIEYKALEVDDGEALSKLRTELFGKQVLLIAPGASILEANERLDTMKRRDDIVKIGINAAIEGFKYEFLFFTNDMRFQYAVGTSKNILERTKNIVTSNVIHSAPEAEKMAEYVINFNGLVKRGWVHFDNSVILCLRLLDKVSVGEVMIAGFDGYQGTLGYADGLLGSDLDQEESSSLNKEIADMFDDFCRTHRQMRITFLTESLFESKDFADRG